MAPSFATIGDKRCSKNILKNEEKEKIQKQREKLAPTNLKLVGLSI